MKRELEHAVVHVDPEHPKHSQCVTCLARMQTIPELMPAHTITPRPPWGTPLPKLTSANCSPTQCHTRGLRLWGWLDVLPNSLKQRWTLHSLATALVDIPAVSMPVARSLTTWYICGIVLCDKLHILEWPFIFPSTRCTCIIIMLFSYLLDMPHLSGGWIILVQEKCSLTGM